MKNYTKKVVKKLYNTKQIQVSKGHKLYSYFDDMCHKANNLYNATTFYIRQYATAIQSFEDMKPLYEHQMNVYLEVKNITKDTKYQPASKWLTYTQLDYVFKRTGNVDYYALPAQVNQQIMKLAFRDFKSYFESIKLWKTNPSLFTSMPRMPGYKKSGASTTTIFTNQVCVIKDDEWLKLPHIKDLVFVGKDQIVGLLKEVRIKPHFVGFTIDLVFEQSVDGEIVPNEKYNEKLLAKYKELTTIDERALAIDTGLSNLCSVVNNFGENLFIIKGTILKSINHYYNKQLAYYQSIAKKVNDTYYTNKLYKLTRKRNNQIKDYMHKTTTYIANYAKEHNVKIVVIGHNKFQKQEINIGKVNNQNFVQIPMMTLINQLQYKLNKLGIELVVVEESYTSKASFENLDFLPTYGDKVEDSQFSGKRIHRGLYQSNGKKPINADINGAANIYRKVFPNLLEWNIGVVDTPVVVRVA